MGFLSEEIFVWDFWNLYFRSTHGNPFDKNPLRPQNKTKCTSHERQILTTQVANPKYKSKLNGYKYVYTYTVKFFFIVRILNRKNT